MLGSRAGKALAAAAVVAAVAATVVFREPLADAILGLVEMVERLGAWAPVVFTAALALAVPLCLPTFPFLLASGVLFGPLLGVVWAALGAGLGGGIAFLLGRRLLRAWVERRLARESGFEALSRALRREGARSITLVRLSPVLPAWLVNYALGASRVRWRDYWLSTAAVLPAVALYALAGAGIGDLAALQRRGAPDVGLASTFLLGAGVVATLAATVLLTRRARRILDRMES